MTNTDDALVEKIARVLDPWVWDDNEDDDPNTFRRLARWHNRLDERPASRERARAVLPIVREAQAAALRDAADAWHAENHGTMPRPYRWMWDRADTIEKGDGQ